MEIIQTPAGGIGVVNAIYTTGAIIYFQNKYSTLSSEIDAVHNEVKSMRDSCPQKRNDRNDPTVNPAIEDLYDRVEALERENIQSKERIMRLEYLLNATLSTLSLRGIQVEINQQQRRVPKNSINSQQPQQSQKLPKPPVIPTTPISSSVSTVKQESCASFTSNTNDDEDVAMFISSVKKSPPKEN